MSHVHVCLVSKQAQPNVIPILMEKPDHVVLVTSKQARKERWHERVQAACAGLTMEWIDVEDSPSLDYSRCREHSAKLLGFLSENRKQVTLNCTGGTKLLAMAYHDVFRALAHGAGHENWREIYCNTDLNRVDVLWPPGSQSVHMSDELDIERYLDCQGAKLLNPWVPVDRWLSRAQHRVSFSAELLEFSIRCPGPLGKLNSICAAARGNAERGSSVSYSKIRSCAIWRTCCHT